MHGNGAPTRDDLGAAYLQTNPRGGEWLQLESSVASLTFDQVERLAAAFTDDFRRRDARRRVVDAVDFLHGRLGSRWVRWADTFGLPLPPSDANPREILDSPYQLLSDRELGAYVAGLLPLYDAALVILAGEHAAPADYELLSVPWRQVCLPSGFTPATLYGSGTQPALRALSATAGVPKSCLTKMLRCRRRIDRAEWRAATDAVHQAALDLGFPYRGKCLYWEAVAAAETATDESPTRPELAEALWGYAAFQVFGPVLAPTTASLLASPYRAGGRVPPPV